MWGSTPFAGFGGPMQALPERLPPSVKKESSDSHLRSSGAVSGYDIEATDGEIGHVEGYVVDEEAWAIRYIEVATRNWWPGKKVLISPEWIERVSWPESKVFVALTREAIKDAPDYIESMPVTREYENNLYVAYGRPPYWLEEAESKPRVAANRD